MIERFTQGKLRWVNLKRPTVEEIKKITAEFDVPPSLVNDLTTPVPKNSATKADTTIKITLDFPVVKRVDPEHPHEVKFLFSKHYLITVQYEEMEALDRFKRQFEVAETLRKKQHSLTGGHLFVSLINQLYDSTTTKLDYLESKLADIESEIFKNNEKQMVYDISDISKKLISFRHILRGQEDIFREVRPFFETLYGNVFTEELQKIHTLYLGLERHTNTLLESLTALRETNTAMLTTSQNEVMKNLTIMAFITFPLTLISSIFGMNTLSTPIVGNAWDFWIIVTIMISAAAGFFMFFKHKGWM